MAKLHYCQDCGEPLNLGATQCACGWKSSEAKQVWCCECAGQVKAIANSRCDFHYHQFQQRTGREDARDVGLRQAWKKTGIVTKGKTPAEIAEECRACLRRHGFLETLPGPIRRAALEGAQRSEMEIYSELAAGTGEVYESVEGNG